MSNTAEILNFPAVVSGIQEQRVADTDDGYTRLANELYEELIGANLTKNQAKVAHAVCRKTYGFNKKMDRITPTTSTGTAGGTSTFTVNIAPTGATNKDFTVATTDATKATATASGNTVTVTRVATGSAQIIINTEDGNFVAVHTVTVT